MAINQFCIILSFMCVSYFLQGQDAAYRDSLLLQIENVEPEKKKEFVKTYARQFYKQEPKKVASLLEEYFQQLPLTQLDSVDFYYLLGRVSYYKYDLKAHTSNIKAANELLNKYNGPKTEYYYYLKYHEYTLKAKFKYHDGLPKEALAFYLNALDFAELSKNKLIKATVLRDIGAFYIDQKSYDVAQNYLNRSRQVGVEEKPENKEFYIKLYSELSDVYLKLNELDSARQYINLIPPEQYSPSILFTIAGFHSKKDAPLDAIVFLDAIIAKTQNGGLKHWLPFAKMLKGDNLYQLKQYQEAENYWLQSEKEFRAIDDKKNLLEIANRLYNYYKKQGASEKASGYYEIATALKDNAQQDNYSDALKGIEDSYTLKEKELENQVLRKKEVEHEDIIQRQRMIGFLGLLFIGALSALVFVYFKTSSTRKELNKKLEEANNDLKLKNKEVKVIADELKFITNNIPGGVAKLDGNFGVTYSNDYFKNCLVTLGQTDIATNIFQVLGFSNSDLTSFERDLTTQKNISFNWKCPSDEKIYQIQTVNTGLNKRQPEYLLVMEDITQLKQNEELRLLETKQKIKNLETNNEKSTQEKQVLNQSLALKKKELATKMMQISKRNTDLESILLELREIYRGSNNTTKLKLTKVISKLNDVRNIEDGWETFNTYFQEIHPGFLDKLNSRNGNLTANEIRHCTYIKLGLNNREVANMLHVAPKTVEAARYRIKKKLDLSKEDSLSQFITKIK